MWERTVTAIEDKRLLDAALHGADTCTRKQVMAQIKWHTDPSIEVPPTKGNSKLTVRLREEATVDDPCDPCAAEAEVDGKVGNYLFRVEVHHVVYTNGKPEDGIDQLTLKWSSENGAEQYQRFDSENEGLPQSFTESDWLFEFINEMTEKHLGVHLAGGVAPRRGELRKDFSTNPLVDGYPHVRRWDGYCTLNWNSAGDTWDVSEAWSRGTDLFPPDVTARRIEEIAGGKRFTLSKLLLEMPLYTVVIGDAVTDHLLSATDLEINGTPVADAGESASVKVTAINLIKGTTKVTATALTVDEGAPLEDFGVIADNALLINGSNLGLISAAADVQAQADLVVTAINNAANSAAFPLDAAIEATKTIGGAILLAATDGRDIDVEVDNPSVSDRCGFAVGTTTFRGTITLMSQLNADIEIAGANPKKAGFEAGTTPEVQFVAGDYWLSEVRDAVFRSEIEKLRDAQASNAVYEIPPILQLSAGGAH